MFFFFRRITSDMDFGVYPYLAGAFNCTGLERSLNECPFGDRLSLGNCSASYDAAVLCYEEEGKSLAVYMKAYSRNETSLADFAKNTKCSKLKSLSKIKHKKNRQWFTALGIMSDSAVHCGNLAPDSIAYHRTALWHQCLGGRIIQPTNIFSVIEQYPTGGGVTFRNRMIFFVFRRQLPLGARESHGRERGPRRGVDRRCLGHSLRRVLRRSRGRCALPLAWLQRRRGQTLSCMIFSLLREGPDHGHFKNSTNDLKNFPQHTARAEIHNNLCCGEGCRAQNHPCFSRF